MRRTCVKRRQSALCVAGGTICDNGDEFSFNGGESHRICRLARLARLLSLCHILDQCPWHAIYAASSVTQLLTPLRCAAACLPC